MPGRNLYSPSAVVLAKSRTAAPPKNSVFISHKREDGDLARRVAHLFEKMNVDFWLDLKELQAAEPQTATEHRELAEAIEAGLLSTTHLLALITPNTKGSWWVPFEIGTARALQRELAFLLHRDVPQMPSYFVFGEWLNDQRDLLSWAEKLSTEPVLAKLERLSRTIDSSALEPFLFNVRSYR